MYMREDKHENELLIKWGWPQDVSPQFVNANSIEGNKMNDIDVVYTMLTVDMCYAISPGNVLKVHVEKRVNEMVNRLNKTKVEKFPDFQAEREERDRLEREDGKAKMRAERLKQKDEDTMYEKEELGTRVSRSYDQLLTEDNMTSNQVSAFDAGNDSDDFM
ncbi:hypothetical protein CAPTEDRAFT_218337 [Capitella teleta]|uniref:Coiled-coil domain-containing protein 25 n=1 Tax=Capitella teleta TaxID=283909 RepID=R7UK31_CAPTE|nr:hypothetical protein CAPTEDRAFT_218337 [Capitella teleta]|eukprot:ELU06904.1 hypothetical protein CAPTEDRAFT_218337 [Capitella teleta]